ncbi:MAG: hypothetical protein RMI90_12160 [Thermoguttaceae bacterium]|nr:hypothetical protein [Thermoguttaceae bacterium]
MGSEGALRGVSAAGMGKIVFLSGIFGFLTEHKKDYRTLICELFQLPLGTNAAEQHRPEDPGAAEKIRCGPSAELPCRLAPFL